MIRVDSTLATALQRESTVATATPASAGRWIDRGRTVEATSPFATEAGGIAEAARLALLFDGPTVRDRVVVPGRVRGVTKRCVRLTASGLDYALQLDVGIGGTILVVEDPEPGPAFNERIHWGLLTRLEPFARQQPGEAKWAMQVQDW